MINSVTLIGRLKNDPNLKETEHGVSKVEMFLVHNEMKLENGERKTVGHIFKCVAYGALAQLSAEYLYSGSRIGVTGTLRNLDEKYEILVKDIEFLGGK
jgi:single-stranded DNA-binding protein